MLRIEHPVPASCNSVGTVIDSLLNSWVQTVRNHRRIPMARCGTVTYSSMQWPPKVNKMFDNPANTASNPSGGLEAAAGTSPWVHDTAIMYHEV